MSNLKMYAEAEKEKIKELIKSLYNITDDDVLESFVRDSMEFDIENKYDVEGDDYVKPYGVEDSSDNIVKTTPFESLLTSKFVDENENTVNNDFETRFQEDFKKNEEMRFLGFESEVMDIHNCYVEEHGYDAFVELQREIAYDSYSIESESKLNDFDDIMHDLDEDLINNNNSELKL